MRKLSFILILFSLLISAVANAQPFGPPLYIADPVAMKCRYYFAGNEKHFNPRPENYTINIGYTTDFKSEAQACEFFRCVYTNGTVIVDQDKKPIETNLCFCRENGYWNNETGCVRLNQEQKKEGFFSRLFKGWKKSFCEG
ncbi:hypothetical protein HYX08_00375 [Candidatus Woesearchaeota archaeon]|nr:hypothetical protein [Candidatus Woesearchaeota archaeon]